MSKHDCCPALMVLRACSSSCLRLLWLGMGLEWNGMYVCLFVLFHGSAIKKASMLRVQSSGFLPLRVHV